MNITGKNYWILKNRHLKKGEDKGSEFKCRKKVRFMKDQQLLR